MTEDARSQPTLSLALAALAVLLAASAAHAQFGGSLPLPPFLEGRDPATYDIVRSPVRVNTPVLKLVDDGKQVKKGDVVGELKPRSEAEDQALELEIAQKRIQATTSRAAYVSSLHAYKRAELEMREYEGGLAPLEIRRLENQVKLHEAAAALAAAKLAAAREAKTVPEISLKEFELEVLRATLQKDEASARLEAFNLYTRPRKVHELQATIEETRTRSELQRHLYTIENDALATLLSRQKQKLKLIAPRDGIARRMVTFQPNEEPTQVYPSQPILAILDPDSPTPPHTSTDPNQSPGTTSAPRPTDPNSPTNP